MTQTDTTDLKARLRRKTEAWIAGRGDCIILVNPDGPEAADALDAKDRTIERLREALEHILRLRPAGDVATATNTRALVQQMETIARAALQENDRG